MKNYVYSFGGGTADGSANMKNLLGGKGANLAEMNHLDIPVPPGFTITTDVCQYFYNYNQSLPGELETQVNRAIVKIEKIKGLISVGILYFFVSLLNNPTSLQTRSIVKPTS